MENYLTILEDSLRKKISVLDEIAAYNSGQEQLLKQETVSMEELDANMEQKDELIQKLTELDEGFEALYDKIRVQLQENKDSYKEQIKRLQDLITRITDKSVSIQAQEARNKKLVEKYFAGERKRLKQGRQVSKASYDYYKSMSSAGEASVMDQKK